MTTVCIWDSKCPLQIWMSINICLLAVTPPPKKKTTWNPGQLNWCGSILLVTFAQLQTYDFMILWVYPAEFKITPENLPGPKRKGLSSSHNFLVAMLIFRGLYFRIVWAFWVYLEDHPRNCKWLITMVSFRTLRMWDPFQMTEFLGFTNEGY